MPVLHLTKLVLCSRLWTDAPAKTWCVKWHHLTASFYARLLIALHTSCVILSGTGHPQLLFRLVFGVFWRLPLIIHSLLITCGVNNSPAKCMTWMCGLGKYGNYGKQLNNIKHLLRVGAGRKQVYALSPLIFNRSWSNLQNLSSAWKYYKLWNLTSLA